MKKSIILFVSALSLFSFKTRAEIPMPDFMEGILQNVKSYYEKYTEYKEEATKVQKKVMEGYAKAEEGIEGAKKLKEDIESAVDDPAGFATKIAGDMADKVHSDGKDLADSNEKKYVSPSDPTFEEFRKYVEQKEAEEREIASELYAAMYVRRINIVAEGMDKKTPNLNDKQSAYRAMNIRIPEIVSRVSYMTAFDGMFGQFYYMHVLNNFRIKQGEEKGE